MRWRRNAAVVTVAVTVAALGPATADAAMPLKQARPDDPARTVTLVTGDRVTLGADGRSIRTWPAKGREQMKFTARRYGDRVYVVPNDAHRLLAQGRLDRRLFDVATLLERGYSDAKRADLPLIVGYPPAAARSASAPDLSALGLRVTRELSSVDGLAVRAGKSGLGGFWSAFAGGPGASARAATSGIERIWLDGKREVVLDQSVPQVGAPVAWQAGYTGTGVTVAVLDTGIDKTHPDLTGQVVGGRNFTEAPDGDQIGHGTHVASTIAGTGARYRGVAPGAKLLDVKVCGDFFCDESAILAGMEWAATSGARVVNMSLGGADTPDLDPLEEAVNQLSEAHGTLFVIAAGNIFQCTGTLTVGSPASADAALAVGAVDRQDALADFSCRGPRVGDLAIKPDLTAPGRDIVAARAPGTPLGDGNPVDERYTRLSGTSMATPHVAGGAAILAQQHPQWTGDEVKAALMASARFNPAHTAYDQGSGRLDLARAITQTVYASPPSLSYGLQSWPHTDDQPIAKPVTYHNRGTTPLTLSVTLDMRAPGGGPAPAGMFTTSVRSVTVPAGGQASLAVTANTRVAGPDGQYTGRVLATAGDLVVGTPVAVDREVESYNVTFRGIDRLGQPTSDFSADIYTPGEPTLIHDDDGDGADTIRLPRGEYAMSAFVITEPSSPEATVALLGGPRVAVNRDSTINLDARSSRPIDVAPPRSTAALPVGTVGIAGELDSYGFSAVVISRGGYAGVYSGQIGPSGNARRFMSYVWGDWVEPGPNEDFADSPYIYHLTYTAPGRVFNGLVRRPRDKDLAAVRVEHPAPDGRIAFEDTMAALPGTMITTQAITLPFRLPATRTAYFTTEDVEWLTSLIRTREVDGEFVTEARQNATWRSYRPGQHRERWGVAVFGPSLPRPWFPEVWVRQFPETLVFAMPIFTDGTPGHFGYVATDTARTTMYRDGQQVAESDEAGYVLFNAPAAAGAFRVDTDMTQSVYDTSTRITASWRFRSRPVAGPDPATLPVLAVRYSPLLNDAGRAPAGVPYAIPVTVERQPGAPEATIVSIVVEVSYDDGQSWRRVPLIRTGTGWFAPVLHPAGGFVSLRAEAVDADGNSVQQTIIRAYGLQGR